MWRAVAGAFGNQRFGAGLVKENVYFSVEKAFVSRSAACLRLGGTIDRRNCQELLEGGESDLCSRQRCCRGICCLRHSGSQPVCAVQLRVRQRAHDSGDLVSAALLADWSSGDSLTISSPEWGNWEQFSAANTWHGHAREATSPLLATRLRRHVSSLIRTLSSRAR